MEVSSVIRHPKKRAFLAAYAECATITHAAEAAKIERHTHQDWLKKDENYAREFERAIDAAAESLEREARRRAIEGTDKPVYQGGKCVGYIREYSDTLLIFLMKGSQPEKYRERFDHSGNIGTQAKEVKVTFDGDWFGNASRLSAVGVAPSGDGATLPCPVQAADLRKASGKNGNGASGNGNGARH